MSNLRRNGIFLLLGATVACNGNIEPANQISNLEKPSVVVADSILCNLTETIAQETVELECLIDPDQDPHTYNATPSQRQTIETAQLILYGGYGLNPAIEKLVTATKIDAPKVAVNEIAVANPIMSEHDHHDHEEEADHREIQADPHVWHDVQNAIAITEVIRASLTEINPDAAAEYDQNTEQLHRTLQQLDDWIKTQIATIPSDQRVLVTTHEAFNYYVQAYGLDQSSALQGISSETAPTANRLKELVYQIQATNVPTIFTEATGGDRIINTVAREAGVNVADQTLLADSLGTTDSYIEMMQHNTCAITNGLGGECQK